MLPHRDVHNVCSLGMLQPRTVDRGRRRRAARDV